MSTKNNKKEFIRTQIINAAKIYSKELAGKKFLYVTPTYYFEILFLTGRFLHLTGVNTKLTAKDFFDKAKKGLLQTSQFFFDKEHPFDVVKKKLPNLMLLPELTTQPIYIINDMKTLTLIYRYGITNYNFTLGVTEYYDKNNNLVDTTYITRTLRTNDNVLKTNHDNRNCVVDFIFMKDASKRYYTDLLLNSPNTTLPQNINHLLDKKFYD